ncbi:hypothetical protein FACS189445_3670 [Spirochaetia bacterium]|nr:hypothetical protein FACS189445_3670 [Spirochaetia bacterium]
MIAVTELEFTIILDILAAYVPDGEVWAFGSRYRGTAKPYSDLDLAIIGNEKLSARLLGDIRDAFEESNLPFRVDALDWNSLSKEFQAIIKSGYEVIYSPKVEGRTA